MDDRLNRVVRFSVWDIFQFSTLILFQTVNLSRVTPAARFSCRFTRCTWRVISSRYYRRYLRATGDYRPGRPGPVGGSVKTVPTGNNSRRSKRKCLLVTCEIRWKWWRTPTDERLIEDLIDLRLLRWLSLSLGLTLRESRVELGLWLLSVLTT